MAVDFCCVDVVALAVVCDCFCAGCVVVFAVEGMVVLPDGLLWADAITERANTIRLLKSNFFMT